MIFSPTAVALFMLIGGIAVGYFARRLSESRELRHARLQLSRACVILRCVRMYGRVARVPHSLMVDASQFIRDND